MTPIEQHRQEALGKLKRQYEERGFHVDLGERLRPDLKADLVARGPTGTVLVEARMPSHIDEKKQPLSEYARFASARGWRFVVAVVDAKEVHEVESWTEGELDERMREAEALPVRSTARALLAWSVLEAAARSALADSGAVVGASANPLTVVQQLAVRGLISLGEERELTALATARNRVAHGLKSSSPDFDVALRIARRLAQSTHSAVV